MSSTMKSPGQQLKEAREHLGRSQSDMAKETRISIQQIQGLENDRYESIPAPMYVRGFLKLYAKHLGIHPDPLVALYEKIRKGEPLSEAAPEVPTPTPQAVPAAKPLPHSSTTRVSPEFGVEQGLSSPPPPRWDWQAWLEKLPDFRIPVNLDVFRAPKVRYAMMGLALICLLLIVRSCVKNTSPDGESPPVVEDPLLSPPEPVYYQLPSSYQ